MLLHIRTIRLLIEAAEDAGLARADFCGPLEIAEVDPARDDAKVEWTTLVLVMDEISRLVGGDAERLRDIGRRMSRQPSYAPLRRMAGAFVSVRTLYDLANRWVAPAHFPHLRLTTHWSAPYRLHVSGEIPEPYRASLAFIHIFEGSLTQLPLILGLSEATIIESRLTPRTGEIVLDVPRSTSIVARVRRAARAALGAREALAVLEEQREELVENVRALERARAELRDLLDRLPDLVVVHRGGTILWANQAFVATLGYEIGDVIGRSLLDLVAVRSRGAAAEQLRQPPASLRVFVTADYVLVTRTGAEVFVEAAPAQAVVFDGLNARLVVGRDVTERMRMQQKLIVADRLASVGLLAAGVAHEVNNPLAYVLNNIEIARKQLALLGSAGEPSQRVLSVALEGVDRIRVIVRDLLLLSRGDDARADPIDVRRVAASTLALASHEISRTTRLEQDFRPTPLVRASEARIAQILLNLVTNALEAMRTRPRDENLLVVRIACASDGRLLVEVSDNGGGITPADLPRVFEPFFTTKPAGQGTGLGLSIAQRLVVELGGEMAVSSLVGRGTTFQVFLPPAPATEVDRVTCSAEVAR
ncbi:MAG: PAS domain S-box protein [Labilithrix sp.]|nr:PAS domain S-box protein [Labilithrix sp.]